MKFFFLALLLLVINCTATSAHAIITILAAENVYGEVCKEMGGEFVNVISVLNNPTQDPHLFSVNASTAKAAMQADIIVYNGADYDPWMKTLLTKNKNEVHIIEVAQLMGSQKGDNPHLWYKPETMPIFAAKLTSLLSQIDAKNKLFFTQQLSNFQKEFQKIFLLIKNLKEKFKNTPVIATEPIFGYMANSIGLKMYGEDFQLSMMNDIPPTISQIKNFQDMLQQHLVHVLIYNNQVINPLTKRLIFLAQKEKIPIVGLSEMMPKGTTFISWMENQLLALQNALRISNAA